MITEEESSTLVEEEEETTGSTLKVLFTLINIYLYTQRPDKVKVKGSSKCEEALSWWCKYEFFL